jgi:hypothetical protein
MRVIVMQYTIQFSESCEIRYGESKPTNELPKLATGNHNRKATPEGTFGIKARQR